MVHGFKCLAAQNVVSKRQSWNRKVPYVYTHSSLALRVLEYVDAVKWISMHGRHDPAGILNNHIRVSLAISTLKYNRF